MSAGIALPKRVYAHGFLFNRGEKMSKSVGNVVDPFAMVDHYGLDQVRYFFLREVPFGQDGNYSHEAIVGRINSDLANDLGNLAQRSLSMIAKNCDNRVPTCGPLSEEDKAMLEHADALLPAAREHIDNQALHLALTDIFAAVSEANRYFAAQEPWALRKTDPDRMATVLYVTAEVIRQVAILCQPYMPDSSARLLDILAIDAKARSFASLGSGGRLAQGAELPGPKPVFPRYVEQSVV
jgi:methionyl-tRNA synthetase